MERYTPDMDKRTPASNGNNRIRVKDLLLVCVEHWKWFLLSLVVAFVCAFLYLKTTPEIFTRTASIMVKPNDNSGGIEQQLKDLGVQQTQVNVTNEILSLQSAVVCKEVVQRLDLEVEYLHEGFFRDEVLYGFNRPLIVRFEELNDNETASLQLKLQADGKVVLSSLQMGDENKDGKVEMKLGETKQTPLGKISVIPTAYYRKGATDKMRVRRFPIEATATSVKSRLSAVLGDKSSTIIDIRYSDVSIARAEDVLNTIILVYNENWMKDRNQITVSTNEFIKERLGVIEQELGFVEQDISDYKSDHLVPDIQQVGSMAMSQASSSEQEANALSNQIYMIRYVRNYLVDGRHANQLLPSNSGISGVIGSQINEYNEILLRRNNHLANSSLQNPLVVDLDNQLAILRGTIIQSLDDELAILNARQRSIQSNYNRAVAKIASNPQQAKYLLSVERQQKVKESLYLFLLQRREENELTQAFTAYNTRLLEPPHGSMAPTYPVKASVLLYALIIGLGVPALILIAKELLNTSVRDRKDLEAVNVPFVGEIPFVGKRKRRLSFGLKKETPQQARILVTDNKRDVINEAFRVVRTNLEFVLGFESSHKIVMLTSINPGSGKTFITANLSNSIGIKGKKVLAIDLDLRKGSLSEYAGKPHHGLSNYLSGRHNDYHELIVHQDAIDILPCGPLPPNPTELLFSPRFEQMIEQVRKEYDFVFIDCPPVEIVSDAVIAARYVDLTLFVVRAGFLERSLLTDVENWYKEKKYKNLSLILNGTENHLGHYGYHKYGYGYGRYGYGYGYYGKREGETQQDD